MQITVTTKSGSIYFFKEVDGKTHVIRNFKEEGVLAEKVSIVPGEQLTLKFYQLNPYNFSQNRDVSILRSTPVEKIEIA